MKIGLLGYGKMGRTIDRLATAEGDEVVFRVDAEKRKTLAPAILHSADVIIEFSRPEAAVANIEMALEAGVPVVSGTTGWLAERRRVEALTEKMNGAFFYASNFSIGVNVFFALNRELARMMNSVSGYRVDLAEIHHVYKLDAPSGTAITLAEDILAKTDELKGWHLESETWRNDPTRDATFASATPEQLPIRSFREGEVPGTHRITYASTEDSLSIEHRAHGREGFARGAIAAARWLVDKKGVFGMKDLLGL